MTLPIRFSEYFKLTEDAQASLRRACYLEKLPIPTYAICTKGDDDTFISEARGLGSDYLHFESSPEPWKVAFSLAPDFREFLKSESNKNKTLLEKDRKSVAELTVNGFWSFFVWPPPEMRMNAKKMEPHLEIVSEICREFSLYDHLARLQHRRALFLAWDGSFDHALKLSQEAVNAMEKTNHGNPHAGSLALLISGLAYMETATKNYEAAILHLKRARELILKQVGAQQQMTSFLVICQLYQTYKIAGLENEGVSFKTEAQKILNGFPADQQIAPSHIEKTMPWACWQLQNYMGLS